jgi:hypothetical protein
MKKIFSLLVALGILLNASAQKHQFDLNGKFSGKRYQYTADQKGIQQTFFYEFDLKQDGEAITGTSSILSENGDYADIQIKGLIVGDKLHFSEYQINSEKQPEGKVWCLKSGELLISKEKNGNIKLSGYTPSYMAEHFYPCSGGFTEISRAGSNEEETTETLAINDVENNPFQLGVFPNPFFQNTNITYNLNSKSTVTLEVIDITGKRVSVLENKQSKEAGNYTVQFVKPTSMSGVFIAKLTINGKVYSKQMVAVN